ncbi:RNA polymerase-associated protein RapA [Dasania sp. GY-MA-18]|uniref:RNA polymerase-associated protein RapA n=1 Tax=Dasania phycosphaerae TaxID=2950436 RepID=A0A9J6RRE1_9GAMM|nr:MULTISPECIES: RNA polymerase-associated protein RapA [Dasania]MCR8924056.1 RNA polymerase-associated protein RapA [Dasania sp. GY-MA-18]MCZ0866629.1 RNA polymerase-associated protein RapA [Dasania phycosphaerae]MCZ0870214.1 RNA polymerase-associated protein RapA [Dasania phycosphaerae]
MLFVPGQRWVSNTESELGLGIVVEVMNRRVDISFPASGERRTYAVDNAPLNRVRYEVGQQVSTADEQSFTVSEVIEERHCLFYRGLNEQGETLTVPELELNSFVQFSKPQDRLFAGQIDKNRAFQLRCETLEHIRHQQLSAVRGLLGARVQLLPHQLYIASETANRFAPRVLLADEVGLGKTIEAGLVIHHQLMTGRASRVLIVVPDSLVHQWLVEMLRRFNLYFSIFDAQRCQALTESGADNPFEEAQLVLCSLSTFTEHQDLHQQAVAARWDLMVVDEAHHLAWSPEQVSPAYQCVEALAQTAQGLLLLTATPEQLGIESHFSRLRLLDPDRYYDVEKFIAEEQNYQPVNELVQKLMADSVAEHIAAPAFISQLTQYLGDSAVAHLQQELQGAEPQQAINHAIELLLDQHGTGRVLFRNTRSSVAGFPDRHLHTHPLTAPSEYTAQLAQAELSDSLRPETLLGDEQWLTIDPRVQWLSGWLRERRSHKVLVICARAETALDLELHLRLKEGVQSAVFHEGLSLVARDRAAAYFSDDEDGAQVLICSEIGSEGRNFQFAHHLVLFDLPLNPDLLEQRIGRLDRIGQRHDVQIHCPYYQGSAQETLLRWYHEGLNAFEKTCPAGNNIYQQVEAELLACLRGEATDQQLAQLLSHTQQISEQTLAALQQGRDRLVELNSFNEAKAERVVAAFIAEERRHELAKYMEQVFDLFGVDQEEHSALSTVIHPGDHMLCHNFPGLPEDGMTATYQRELALSREDIQFLTWEHPMVTGAMDMILGGELGNTALATIKLPPIKPGTLMLEAVFTVQCTAPPQLQLHRYLPLTTIRIVVDANNNDLSNILSAQRLAKLVAKVPKRVGQDLVRQTRKDILALIEQAETLATAQQQDIVASAQQNMLQQQTEETERLKALAQRNPNIRQEEIDFQLQATDMLSAALQQARIKLEAVRLLVAV